MRVKYSTMYEEFLRVLLNYDMEKEQAKLSAKLFCEASLDGVYTHGLNRFPKFIKSVDNGSVIIGNNAEFKENVGILERWDGKRGPGNLNAYTCMKRAIEISKQATIGCVALSNTNHWMRPGAYGLMAAEENCIGILWTNTVPNMPAWGGKEAKLGNNPIVMCVPREGGPVLLDISMSMFSYGKLESYARNNETLPIDGGFDVDGNITRDAAKVLETHQPLPIGYWKGSGLSLMLDLIASALAGGRTTRQVGELENETELSQVFISINLSNMPDSDNIKASIEQTIQDLHTSTAVNQGKSVRYPGEGRVNVRKENEELGIPVDKVVWENVLKL